MAKTYTVTWHDLRLNPEDLPKKVYLEEYSSWVIDNLGYQVRYRYDGNYWESDRGERISDNPPIAWCEFPYFDDRL